MTNLHERINQLSDAQKAALQARLEQKRTIRPAGRPLGFGLLFFSSDGSGGTAGKYDLLMDAARLADAEGFSAIWTPERHFQTFGGLYPNPAVLAAALAMVTRRIQLRAGSVVVPLHDPVRVAEEWAIVDNLSGGRVALSFASGWHRDDFAFRPDAFETRRETLEPAIDTIRRLWAGEPLTLAGVGGKSTEIRTFPRPVQPAFSFWLTGASRETWSRAARLGANVLCLMGPSLADLREKIKLYREERLAAGFDPAGGKITVTLHTFIDDDLAAVKRQVRAPLTDYLEDYVRQFRSLMPAEEVARLEGAKESILDFAFERYFNFSSLLGDRAKCIEMLNQLTEAGVDEVACLVDFGLSADTVMAGLRKLAALRREFADAQAQASPAAAAPVA
ncbi:MupA/Atu3671 family FMN-dependent luciferase-like monooxygenase [Burkholderia sp. 22PA0099]|uniref:MupA/Atu3671 family FMN-dependent luciferase-like monooxygenase n=1 Tax=Burkholderia sp. 22PA0099 TaxID=3237372 RepID=UPI0039C3A6F8